MKFNMNLQWKAGQNHLLPDARSRLPRFEVRGEDIDDPFLGDASNRQAYREPWEPVLDGVLLSEMGLDRTGVSPPESVAAVAGAIATPDMSLGAIMGVEEDRAELQSAPERPTTVVLG